MLVTAQVQGVTSIPFAALLSCVAVLILVLWDKSDLPPTALLAILLSFISINRLQC